MQSPPRSRQTVPVLNDTGMPAFTMPWQLAPPQDALVVVVKGTFRIEPGGSATLAGEQVLPTGEEPFEGAETIRYPGDEAIFKPRADLLIGGAVHGGADGYARAQVRFGRELDLTFAAVGNRTWQAGRPSRPESFSSVPLRAELAFGGPGHSQNPWGRGFEGEDGSPLPNLERLDAPVAQPSDRPPPLLLGPLPRSHPSRTRALGTYDARWERTRWPYFPDDFDWGSFNAAPPELQIPHPRGDESFSFAGLHPELPRIDGRLPDVSLGAFVQRVAAPDRLEPVRLRIDTLHFTPDALQLIVVWRGVVDVADEEASDLGAVLVTFAADAAAQEAAFRSLVRQRTERAPEPAPEPASAEAARPPPPDGMKLPKGLTPAGAAALGLPPWAATVDGPPPARPTIAPPILQPLDPADVRARLEAGGSLVGEDLTEADLRGLVFDGCDLRGAILARAQLEGASFRGANLEGAVLTGARGHGLVFHGAELARAELSGLEAPGADFTDASLSGAALTEATLESACFDGASAAGARWMDAELSGATFRRAQLTRADMSGVTLDGALFEDAVLVDLRLYDACGSSVVVRRAQASGMRADGAKLGGSVWEELEGEGSSWRDADLFAARFPAAALRGAVFVSAQLGDAVLDRVDGRDALFRLARLSRASLRNANLMKACFESADLAEADLRLANLYGAETWKANLSGVRLDGALTAMSKLAR